LGKGNRGQFHRNQTLRDLPAEALGISGLFVYGELAEPLTFFLKKNKTKLAQTLFNNLFSLWW